jgi:uncharacterized protein YxjI
MKPRLFIEQKITAFVNKYKVFGADDAGNHAGLISLAQQKRLAFKEKVTFYIDEQKTAASFSFRAEKVLDVHGRYFVEDPNGQLLGMFKKEFLNSLVNSTWKVMDASGTELFTVRESNEVLAVLRRFGGWIPIVGDIMEIVILFFKYHFVFIDSATGQEVGKYQKTTLFRDHYTLFLTDEAYEKVDWRVLSAMGVGLDALQSR